MFQVRRRNENDLVMRQNAVALEDGTELEYLTFPLLEELGVAKHLFTTRLGGVSKGEFSSMNLSFTRGDSHGDVLANYERIAGILGCRTEDMAASHQTHTTNIRRVGPADRGKGIVRERDYENVDGLITDEPGLALVTYYADCVPLYFVDPVHRAIGLAHSGWRGTVGKMGKRMTEAMGEQFGSRPEEAFCLDLTFEIWPYGSSKAKECGILAMSTRLGLVGTGCYAIGRIGMGREIYTLVSSDARRELYAMRDGAEKMFSGKSLAELVEKLLFPSEWKGVEWVERYQ